LTTPPGDPEPPIVETTTKQTMVNNNSLSTGYILHPMSHLRGILDLEPHCQLVLSGFWEDNKYTYTYAREHPRNDSKYF